MDQIKKIPGKPWIVQDRWSVSQYNFASEIRNGWKLPEHVYIHDTTLRDGEQTPGVVFRMKEKIEIAHALEDLGVQRIEGGYASVSSEDATAITQMTKEIKKAEISSFSRARLDDIDLALKCNVQRIILELPTNDEFISNIWGSREKAAEAAIKLVKHAKENGLKVTLFLFDSSRADLELINTVVLPAVREGKPDSVCIVDTMGCTMPAAFGWWVRKIKELLKIRIEAHCHNRWGMATANSIAAVCAGAEVVHTCVNCLGGNTAIDEAAMCVNAFLGIDTGLKTEKLYSLSRLVKNSSGADWQKAFVGDTESIVEIGIESKSMWDHRNEPAYGSPDGINYDVVGAKNKVVLGKKSSKYTVMLKSEELGLSIPSEEEMVRILEEVKGISERNKRIITNDEFKSIYTKMKT